MKIKLILIAAILSFCNMGICQTTFQFVVDRTQLITLAAGKSIIVEGSNGHQGVFVVDKSGEFWLEGPYDFQGSQYWPVTWIPSVVHSLDPSQPQDRLVYQTDSVI